MVEILRETLRTVMMVETVMMEVARIVLLLRTVVLMEVAMVLMLRRLVGASMLIERANGDAIKIGHKQLIKSSYHCHGKFSCRMPHTFLHACHG